MGLSHCPLLSHFSLPFLVVFDSFMMIRVGSRRKEEKEGRGGPAGDE